MQESPILILAEDILSEMPRKEGHVDQITQTAINQNNNMGLDFESLKQRLSAALSSAVKRKSGSQFARVLSKNGKPGKGPYRRGVYRLKRVLSAENFLPTPPATIAAFLGKAGEHAVASELMFRNFNISFMVVDKGVDLIAEKDNNYHHIQVKTSSENEGAWQFTVKLSSFTSSHGGQTYYVLVLRKGRENLYIVLPSSQLDVYITTGLIKAGKSMSLRVSRSTSGKTWYLNNTDVTHFVSAFHVIK